MCKFLVEIVICCLILFGLFSCEKEVDIVLPEYKKLPVLNSFFTSTRQMKVHLSYSSALLNDSNTIISDAQLFLLENNIYVDTLTFIDGYYLSSIIPQSNKSYKIKYENENYGTISSENTIPDNPEIINYTYTDNTGTNSDGLKLSRLNLVIKDDVNQENFYELVVLARYVTTTDNNGLIRAVWFEKNNDIVLENEGLIQYSPNTLIFSDLLFNGNNYNLNTSFIIPIFETDDGIVKNNYRVIFKLRSISKDYYLYKKHLIKQQASLENDFFNGTGNPVKMYSNIIGGLGIFAGYNEVIDSTEIIYLK